MSAHQMLGSWLIHHSKLVFTVSGIPENHDWKPVRSESLTGITREVKAVIPVLYYARCMQKWRYDSMDY